MPTKEKEKYIKSLIVCRRWILILRLLRDIIIFFACFFVKLHAIIVYANRLPYTRITALCMPQKTRLER